MSLQVSNLVKHFGGVQAVKGVSFTVQPGECVALIGPNGAGKSTTFACIAGQHALTSGQVAWGGQRVDLLTPQQRLQQGIARTFQVAKTFEALTVLQNVQLLTQAPRGIAAYNVLENADSTSAMALLVRVGLQDLAQADAKDLPYGAKKRLELAMALAGLESPSAKAGTTSTTSTARSANSAKAAASMLLRALQTADARPQLLLLDEPAAGLAQTERAALMLLVKDLTQSHSDQPGMAVLYTEHNMDAVFGVADRVLVLIDGLIAAQGTPDEIANNPVVRARYLGQSFSAPNSAYSIAGETSVASAQEVPNA
jgi:branched-chain amino acid transport system ATP-binding protein